MAVRNYEAKPVILGIMADYDVSKAEKALIVFDGGETDYLIKRFLLAKKVQGCTDRTCETYNQCLRFAFGSMAKSPTVATHVDIQAVIARMILKGNSKAYQSIVYRSLSSFYGWAVREEIIVKNPILKVDSIKMRAPKKSAFEEIEVERIREACQTWREKAMIEILLSTGCRAFEVTGLTIAQVAHDEVEIVGKGEKPRTVYINARSRIAIEHYLGERRDSNPYLFPGSVMIGKNPMDTKESIGKYFHGRNDWYTDPALVHPTAPLHTDGLRSVVHAIGKRANVPDCHPHRFRRTCATMALRRGMPVTLVQMMLGHDSLTTTQRYLDIKAEELKTAHQKYVT